MTLTECGQYMGYVHVSIMVMNNYTTTILGLGV